MRNSTTKRGRSLRLRFITAPAGDTGSGAGTPAPAAPAAGATTEPGTEGAPGAEGTPPAGGGDQTAFTPEQQAKVDKIVADRLVRERATSAEQARKAKLWDDQEAAKKPPAGTPSTPGQTPDPAAPVDFEATVKAAVDAALATATKESDAGLVRAEIKAQAAALGFHNPALAAIMLANDSAVDLSTVLVTDGQPDATAVAALVKTLADANAFLIKTGAAGQIPGVGQTGGGLDPTSTASPGKDRIKAAYDQSSPQ